MKTGRKTRFYISFVYTLFGHVRAIATLLCIPALLYGCSSDGLLSGNYTGTAPEETSVTEISIYTRGMSEESPADIFVFNDDRLGRLDSYQRVYGSEVYAASRRGERIVVAIVNSHREPEEWKHINSYEGLLKETALLEDDDPANPVMTGEARISAGETMHIDIEVTRLMSQICINSLRADFLGTEYENEELTDVRIYLTNLNAECCFLKYSDFSPGLVVNFGGLDQIYSESFAHREMIVQETGKVGPKGMPDPIRLFCYPSDHTAETSGSPFTRLVIEGKIRGHVYYYPITVNRPPYGESGIGRNCQYVYDITINRSGTPDPDIPVEEGCITVTGRIQPWTEMDDDTIFF